MPTPSAGSRSPGAARGSRARAPLCARARPLSDRAGRPGHAQPAAPNCAVSRPSSQSSRQSSGSPTIARRARLGGPGPSELRGHAPQGNTGELALSWLHPLRSWSLRETRCASLAHRAEQFCALATEQGFSVWRAQGTMYHGLSKVTDGEVTEGMSLLRAGLADYRTNAREAEPPA